MTVNAAVVALGIIVGSSGAADAAVPTPASAPVAKIWSVNHDVGVDPADNPIGDSYGDAGVWSYLGGSATDPSTYTSLDTYASNGCGTDGFYVHSAPAGVPLLSYNATSSDYPCGGIHFPIDTVNMHPANDADAILAWTSPITGSVDLAGDLADNDAGGGNGIAYELATAGSDLATGAYGNGGSLTIPSLTAVPVTAGQSIYLHIQANGGYDYDSTAVDFTVTQHIVAVQRSTPKVLGQGARKIVTILGSGFTPDTSVSLDNADGIGFAGPLTITPTAISVPVSVDAGAPTGGVSHWYVSDPSLDGGALKTNKFLTLSIDAAPVVTAVDPNTVVRGTPTELTLTGAGFQPGMAVYVSGKGVTRSHVTIDSPTQARITVTVDPAQKATRPGAGRFVRVTNHDGGTSTLTDAIAVS